MRRPSSAFQDACSWVTLQPDRITKRQIINEKADEIFKNTDSAEQIHKAIKKKFGEENERVLKTKTVPIEIVMFWQKLNKHYSSEEATKHLIAFIEKMSDDEVKSIAEAKTQKGKLSKEEQQKGYLNEYFYKFVGAQGLNT